MTDRPALDEADDPAAWAQAVLRGQVERLDQLAEAGLRLALTIERRVGEASDPSEAPAGAVSAFARMARAVRQCGLLQSKLIKDMEQLRASALICGPRLREAAEERVRLDRFHRDPAHAHKARVEGIVERVARAAHREDEDTVERLMCEAAERLDDDDIYGDVLTRPVGELVALICRDLGLDPDWTKLAEEAWAQAEGITPSRPPPYSADNGGGGPSAEQSEQPMVAGADGLHPPFHNKPAESGRHQSG